MERVIGRHQSTGARAGSSRRFPRGSGEVACPGDRDAGLRVTLAGSMRYDDGCRRKAKYR